MAEDRVLTLKVATIDTCPFCGSRMQYAESGRYAEWLCKDDHGHGCIGHADIPLAWLYGPIPGSIRGVSVTPDG